jgi:predicted enzyme related to lactoylglutathione lyase
MLRGLTTVTYFADDVPAAARWYADVAGTDPYFVRPEAGPPAYVEFRLGDLQAELGILDRRYAPSPPGPAGGGVVAYWAVDDARASFDRLLSLGATVHQEPIERGPGYVTASVVDPFGNVLGVMANEHYVHMVAGRATA